MKQEYLMLYQCYLICGYQTCLGKRFLGNVDVDVLQFIN